MQYRKGDHIKFKIALNDNEYETTGEIFIYKSDQEITIWKVQGIGAGKLSQCIITKDAIIEKVK